MKKFYYKPECEAFLCDEELLASGSPNSLKDPTSIDTNTPGGTDDINPDPSPWEGPGVGEDNQEI